MGKAFFAIAFYFVIIPGLGVYGFYIAAKSARFLFWGDIVEDSFESQYSKTKGKIVLSKLSLDTRVPVKKLRKFMAGKRKDLDGVEGEDDNGETCYYFGKAKTDYLKD